MTGNIEKYLRHHPVGTPIRFHMMPEIPLDRFWAGEEDLPPTSIDSDIVTVSLVPGPDHPARGLWGCNGLVVDHPKLDNFMFSTEYLLRFDDWDALVEGEIKRRLVQLEENKARVATDRMPQDWAYHPNFDEEN